MRTQNSMMKSQNWETRKIIYNNNSTFYYGYHPQLSPPQSKIALLLKNLYKQSSISIYKKLQKAV